MSLHLSRGLEDFFKGFNTVLVEKLCCSINNKKPSCFSASIILLSSFLSESSALICTRIAAQVLISSQKWELVFSCHSEDLLNFHVYF